MISLPRYDDLPLVGGVPCAWGLWGRDDVVGAVNRLDDDAVLAARQEIKVGTVIPLNWSLLMPNPPLYGRDPISSRIRSSTSFSKDDVLDDFNPQSSTQWDGFRHIQLPGVGYYNARPDAEHGVAHMHDHGVVGRGVLVDVERWRAENSLPVRCGESDVIGVADLQRALSSQDTTVRPADILLIRTGWIGWYESLSTDEQRELATTKEVHAIGLEPSAEMARFLWDSGVSAVATDNPGFEVAPIGCLATNEVRAAVERDISQRYLVSLHTRVLVMLGLPIGELFVMDRLASACRSRGNYAFFFASVPLNLPNGVSSPANAIAIL